MDSLPEEKRSRWEEIRKAINEVTVGSVPENTLIYHYKKCSDGGETTEIANRIIEMAFNELDDGEKNKRLIGPLNHDMSAASTSTAMELVPYEEPNNEHQNLAEALKNSMIDNSALPPLVIPENPLELLRDVNVSAGLLNSGNTCWFNCIAQMLYSIARFRSLVYHAVPSTWFDNEDNITNVQPERKLHAELLIRLRSLFAEMQFTNRKYLVVDQKLLVVLDQLLQRKPGAGGRSTMGHQQDVSELLTFIMEWTFDAIKAATFAIENPEYSNESKENKVLEGSTSEAPNSDVVGTEPPIYQDLPSTSSVARDPKTRDNSPVAVRLPTPMMEPIVEDMDTSTTSEAPMEDPQVPNDILIPSLKNTYDELFAALRIGFNEETLNKTTETGGSPEMITLTVQQGNLHDAMELYTCSTDPAQPSTFDLYRKLPNVIFLGLNRYKSGIDMQEKADNRFEFPTSIFMDRYLEVNKDEVRELRRQRKGLREQLSDIRARLKGVLEYPHGDGTTKLSDAFQTVMEAIGDMRVRDDPCQGSSDDSVQFVRDAGKIYPRFEHPNAAEMNEKLGEMIGKLKETEEEFTRNEEDLKTEIDQIFERDSLRNVQYDLYTVIAHAGALNQGHYWIYKRKGDTGWEKINDNTAESVEWNEKTQSEVYGKGNRNDPSAYVLMYMKASEVESMSSANTDDDLRNIPVDLQQMVKTRRSEFERQCELFRARGATTEPQTSTFSWYGRLPLKTPGDENANQVDFRRVPIDKQGIPLLEKEENSFMENRTQLLWNMINTIAPGRFGNHEHVLKFYLQEILDMGGWSFIERELGYPLRELNNDAVNDIHRAFDKYVSEYMGIATPNFELTYKTHSPFLFFVATQMLRVEVPLVRYFLIAALCQCGQKSFFTYLATDELGRYICSTPDQGNTLIRIGHLIGQMYEMRELIAWNCRKSMDCVIRVFDKKLLKSEERIQSYIALIANRNARVGYRTLKKASSFLDRDGDTFIASDFVEIANIGSALAMVKVFFEHISDRRKSMKDMEFYMPGNERRITLEAIVAETKLALNGLVKWKNLAMANDDLKKRSSVPPRKRKGPQTPPSTPPPTSFSSSSSNTRKPSSSSSTSTSSTPPSHYILTQERRIQLYQSVCTQLTAKLECFAAADCGDDKQVCISELCAGLRGDHQQHETLTDMLSGDPELIAMKLSQATKFQVTESINKFGDVLARVEEMLSHFDTYINAFFV
uniref:USP domain-containing protein n=1 Tax=Caenorhabditis tropicalis TaxID=1561998 RepID=A0A1I7TNV4_9PELO